jgi:hypothetical protein
VLFAPTTGPLQAGLRTPMTLFSPDYGKPKKTQAHRSYQTIQGLSGRLNVPINTPFAEGQEPALATAVVADYTGVVLICWEHQHIPRSLLPCPPSRAPRFPPPGRVIDSI